METNDEIRALCRRLLRSDDPSEAQAISEQLQRAIHHHIEALRLKLLANLSSVPRTIH